MMETVETAITASTGGLFVVRLIPCLICCIAAFQPLSASADSCSEYNTSYYCDNGKVYNRYNNSLYDEQGKAWSAYGSTVYSPDHEAFSEYGQTLYDQKGKAWSVYGNTIYQPDGSSCSWYANTLYCQKQPDSNGKSISPNSRAAILMQQGLYKAGGN